jgi:ABC-type sugar transport system permease subunit
MRLENMSYVENYVFHAASNEGTVLSELTDGFNIGSYLSGIGIAGNVIDYIMNMLYAVSQMITASGVQILIFLAALQTVSPSLFEASSIEGATSWDNFWKITFPMMTPYILVNCIYSIIDSLSRVDSSPYNLTRLIEETVNRYFDYGLASAMSWIYFIAVALFLALVSFIVSKIVFYYN